MSGVAKVEKAKVMSSKPPDMVSTMRVNLKKHKEMDGNDIGKKVHFSGHGVITSINKDDYGHTMGIDVHDLMPTKEK